MTPRAPVMIAADDPILQAYHEQAPKCSKSHPDYQSEHTSTDSSSDESQPPMDSTTTAATSMADDVGKSSDAEKDGNEQLRSRQTTVREGSIVQPHPYDMNMLKQLVTDIIKQGRWSDIVPRTEEVKPQPSNNHLREATSLVSYIESLEKKVASFEEQNKTPKELEKKSEESSERIGKLHIKRLKKEKSNSEAVVDDSEDIKANRKEKVSTDTYAMTVCRDVEKNNQRTLEIKSLPLMELFRKVVTYYPGQSFQAKTVSFKSPYMVLFHHRNEILKEIENGKTDEETKDLAINLFDFLASECPDVSQELDGLDLSDKNSIISFAGSWLLFKPGTIVFSTHGSDEKGEGENSMISAGEGEQRAYVVEEISGHENQLLPSGREILTSLELRCWAMDYDGSMFGRAYTNLYIRPFNGSKKVSSLEVVPSGHLINEAKVREDLIERGRQFWAFKDKNMRFKLYSGKAWSKNLGSDFTRVIVDHGTYQRKISDNEGIEGIRLEGSRPKEENHCGCRICTDRRDTARKNFEKLDRTSSYARYNSIDPEKDEPDELALLLCPERVFAFSLRQKEWKPIKIKDLTKVDFRKKAFEKLVVKEEYKKTVEALVSTYASEGTKFKDIVNGKGKGLVLLLHGPPGTGKTLTAECVADEYQRPLYMVTCGDLGTEPYDLESNLKEILDNAATWNAVLLLDEADVFLRVRDYADLKQNALVSIFLRELEYFDGILFLTTNRIGAIDEAFQSRIHVTLGLPALDSDSRREIWSIFIKDLSGPHKDQRKILAKHVKEKLCKININGRQIRNCVRTALALADQDNEPLAAKHLDRVVELGNEFTAYMLELHGQRQEELQQQIGNRLASKPS